MSFAQTRLEIEAGTSYSGDILIGSEVADDIFVFDKIPAIEEKIGKILSLVGTSNDLFISMSGTVKTAAAIISDQRKLIVYNQDFFDRLSKECDPSYAVFGVLAHEIGHHFHDHGLRGDDVYQEELQADYFSGVYLARLGATLEQAKCGLERFASTEETTQHPARSDRLAALAAGYASGFNQTELQTVPLSQIRELPLNGVQIKEVQNALNLLGYSAGEVDGVLGIETRSAVAIFQKDNAFDPSGVLDRKTFDTLMRTATSRPSIRNFVFAASMAGIYCKYSDSNIENGLIDGTSRPDPSDRVACYEIKFVEQKPRFRVIVTGGRHAVVSKWLDVRLSDFNEFTTGKHDFEMKGDSIILKSDTGNTFARRSLYDASRF